MVERRVSSPLRQPFLLLFPPAKGVPGQRELFGVGGAGFPPLPLLRMVVNKNTGASSCGFGVAIEGGRGIAATGQLWFISRCFGFGSNGHKSGRWHKGTGQSVGVSPRPLP